MNVLRLHWNTRNALSLIARAEHTRPCNILISLDCHSYPSWAHSKTCAQKTVFSRPSTLFSSVHCTHGAHETSHCTRALYPGPSSLPNWKSRVYPGSGTRQPSLITTHPSGLHKQNSTMPSLISHKGQERTQIILIYKFKLEFMSELPSLHLKLRAPSE